MMRILIPVLLLAPAAAGAQALPPASAPSPAAELEWMTDHAAGGRPDRAEAEVEARAGFEARGAARVPLDVSRGRSHALAGAAIGFVVGAGATYAVLYSGGSTSLCDRSANQDAIRPRECTGLTALGGLAGAGLGAMIGARLRTGRGQAFSTERHRVALAPLLARRVGLTLAVAF